MVGFVDKLKEGPEILISLGFSSSLSSSSELSSTATGSVMDPEAGGAALASVRGFVEKDTPAKGFLGASVLVNEAVVDGVAAAGAADFPPNETPLNGLEEATDCDAESLGVGMVFFRELSATLFNDGA